MEFVIGLLILIVAVVTVIGAFILRRVVPPNEVHIVQSTSGRTTYGMSAPDAGDHVTNAGATKHTYYAFPASVPKFGVQIVKLPTTVFDQDLKGYEAYDKDRVPFVLDVKAFFRIFDPQLAAERVPNADLKELLAQLEATLQGAVRTILASSTIEEIMQGRSEFGTKFTAEVDTQLREWGVKTVKSIELMDIRDSQSSKVIQNIMAKKTSFIHMESRVEVAKNTQAAEIAEIDAKRQTDLQRQEAEQRVGIRTAEAAQAVGIAREKTHQAVQGEAKVTAEAEAEVRRVQAVKSAEIARDVQVVHAEQSKRTDVIAAEAKKQTTELVAQGQLAATENEAKGVALIGTAKAEAEKAMQIAPVEAQILLAKEIGTNQGYQTYLIGVKTVEANRDIGIAQASALENANIKIIANSGSAPEGIKSVGELFSSAGGTKLGAMVEAFAQTEHGQALIETVTGSK